VKGRYRKPSLVTTQSATFATGKQVAKGYVVKVETSILEAGQKRGTTMSCGPNGHCFLLGSGRYPARWLHDPDQLELIGGMGKSLQKAHYSVAAPSSSSN
jgi:hypothetical protein